MSKRAIRRHHRARLKKKRASYWGATKHQPMTPKQQGVVVKTPKPCSCWMCGVPRDVHGKPFNWLRLEQDKFYQDE